jgi:hydroxypyruvate reductase
VRAPELLRLVREVVAEIEHVVAPAAQELRGRNTEYLASLALALDGAPGVYALAADTDGIDGHGDHAGAIVVPETLRHGAERGESLAAALARHDTYSYFDSGRYLLKTGPTRTNVNDFRLILCQP